MPNSLKTDKPIVDLPVDYKPREDEEYMSPMQLEYFRRKLVDWKQELQEDSGQFIESLQDSEHDPDSVAQATLEADAARDLRRQDRYRKLVDKIDAAIMRIENESYGYCEETGEPIGIGRLEARPIASFSLEAQERHERFEKHHSDEE